MMSKSLSRFMAFLAVPLWFDVWPGGCHFRCHLTGAFFMGRFYRAFSQNVFTERFCKGIASLV